MEQNTGKITYLGTTEPGGDPGSRVEQFNAIQLAQVLEFEIGKAHEKRQSKLRLTMDLTDCVALAKCLRRAAIMGA